MKNVEPDKLKNFKSYDGYDKKFYEFYTLYGKTMVSSRPFCATRISSQSVKLYFVEIIRWASDFFVSPVTTQTRFGYY